jgi:hypothetical protein
VAAVEESCEVAAITRTNDCGLLAQPGNARDLADRILDLYRDRNLAERLGANARTVGLSFDRSLQVEKYMHLFTTVAPRTTATPVAPHVAGTAEKL